MSQAMTLDHAPAGYLDQPMQIPGTTTICRDSGARGREQVPGGVPMLDWPADLFGDNATLPELVTVDFLLQCDEPANGHTSH
jgi:hypothetical protein